MPQRVQIPTRPNEFVSIFSKRLKPETDLRRLPNHFMPPLCWTPASRPAVAPSSDLHPPL